MKPNLTIITASLALMAQLASTALAACPACSTCAGGPNADAILKQMSSTLAAAKQFRFAAHRQIDAALLAGRNLPTDANVVVTVQRPNKLAAKSRSKGDVRHSYFDGRNLTLVDVSRNLYSTVPTRTSLDGLVAELDQKYGFTPPLAELALSNVYADIRWKANSISYLGEEKIGGFLGLGTVACQRLALSGKVLDAELWVGVSDHLPRKLVATAKTHAGKPQIKVEFSDWDLTAKTSDQDFVYVPVKGVTKIPMRTTEEMNKKQRKH
jgi:hypothetical protein